MDSSDADWAATLWLIAEPSTAQVAKKRVDGEEGAASAWGHLLDVPRNRRRRNWPGKVIKAQTPLDEVYTGKRGPCVWTWKYTGPGVSSTQGEMTAWPRRDFPG